MTAAKARQIVLAARPHGRPKPSDFASRKPRSRHQVPGRFCFGSQYLSLDPYMRGRMDDRKSYATPVPLGGVMQGEPCNGDRLKTSRLTRKATSCLPTRDGARTRCRIARTCASSIRLVAPVTTGLGVLGMPGFTAYGGCALSASPSPEKQWSSRRRVDRSARWSASSRRSPAPKQLVSRAAPKSARM